MPPGSLCTLSVSALEWLKDPSPPTENAGREEGFSRREQPFSNSHITEPKSPATSKASPPILLCRSQRPETVTLMSTRDCRRPRSRKHLCLLGWRVPGLPWRQRFHIRQCKEEPEGLVPQHLLTLHPALKIVGFPLQVFERKGWDLKSRAESSFLSLWICPRSQCQQ